MLIKNKFQTRKSQEPKKGKLSTLVWAIIKRVPYNIKMSEDLKYKCQTPK